MKIEVNKRDVINMIRGSYPYEPEDRNIAFVYKLASSCGGVCDTFTWKETNDEAWNKFEIEWLYQYYQRLEKNDIFRQLDSDEFEIK